ncbi:MAG: DUF3137 domain-containing protein [Verrucomicrobiales bacterium]|jgi:hypothetical protein|nr:DUF3137 domain-containing protein [Verrucomicrobiales bacterium]
MLPFDLVEKLAPSQHELEQYRQKLRAGQRKNRLIIVSLSLIFIALIAFAYRIQSPELAICSIIGLCSPFIYASFCNNSPETLYQNAYKQMINPVLLQHFSSELHYDPDHGLPSSDLAESKLFTGSIDRYSSTDLVSGTYGKTKFRFSQVSAEELHKQTSSRGGSRTYYTIIFQGLLFIADFNKNFSGHTYVRTDFAEKHLGNLGRFLQEHNLSSDEVVQLENPEFEKAFAVYTNNQVEARYILTPAMMDNLLDLRQRCITETQYSFHDSSITVAIANSTLLFTPNFKCPATNNEQLEAIYNQLDFFLSIINDLDLNTRIWSKE